MESLSEVKHNHLVIRPNDLCDLPNILVLETGCSTNKVQLSQISYQAKFILAFFQDNLDRRDASGGRRSMFNKN